ncbi:DMT family transporter [Methylocella sp.]|uniref:DMT family transporter n=1 Tax=Methylocella sp. TaxID=1978226 RepID=UPI0037852D54
MQQTAGANLTRGILLAFAAFAVFAFSDASVKLIDGELPPIESAFFGAVFACVLIPFLLRKEDRWTDIFVTRYRALWIVRFCCYPLGVIGAVMAFTKLSMAEAFILIFLQPMFVTIMSTVFLKEQIGVRRWSAVAIGFAGVLIVLRPGFRELSIGHVGAVAAGLFTGVSVITYRVIGSEDKPVSLFGAGMLGGVVVCGVAMLYGFQWPTIEQWILLAGYGLLAAGANLLLMYATFNAPAGYISPTQYSQMLWAILLDYLLFKAKVDAPTVIGIAFIIGSGILTIARERKRGTPMPPSVAVGSDQAPLALTPAAWPREEHERGDVQAKCRSAER